MLTFTEAIEDISKASTMYVRRQLLNAPDIVEWAKSNGFETTLDPIDMHVTVAFSRAEMDWPSEQADGGMSVDGGKRSLKRLGAEGDAVVLTFEAPPLTNRWKEFRSMGASWDWPSYQPHVTISYNAGDMDVSAIRPYAGPLNFGPEIFEPVWKTTITEKSMTEQIDPRVMDYLAKNAPDIAAVISKLQPGAADVHVASAGKGKKKPFKAMLDEQKRKRAEGSDLDDGKPVDTYKAWSVPLKINKVDDDQMKVFGWASVTQIGDQIVIDKQGDIIMEDDLEKAAHDYVLYCREQGEMHERMGVGRLIQSFVFTKQQADCGFFACDMETEEQMFGWAVAFKVDDPGVWKRIRDGSLGEFSIGGKAVRVAVE